MSLPPSGHIYRMRISAWVSPYGVSMVGTKCIRCCNRYSRAHLLRDFLKLRLGRIEMDSLSGKREERLEQQFAINRVAVGRVWQPHTRCQQLRATRAFKKIIEKNCWRHHRAARGRTGKPWKRKLADQEVPVGMPRPLHIPGVSEVERQLDTRAQSVHRRWRGCKCDGSVSSRPASFRSATCSQSACRLAMSTTAMPSRRAVTLKSGSVFWCSGSTSVRTTFSGL